MFSYRMLTAALAATIAFSPNGVFAQSNINTTYVTGLVNTLNQLNLTSLVGALTKIQNTTAAQTLLADISSGKPYTVFAPNNDAWSGVNPFFGNDDTWVGQALAYHVVSGTISLDSIGRSPNVTVYETALTDSSLVKLGGQGQQLGLTKKGNSTQIANQNTPCVVVGQTTYENLQIYILSAVIDLPPSLQLLVTDNSLGLDVSNQLTTLVKQLSTFPPTLEQVFLGLEKVTLFAPINSAFATAIQHNRIPSNQSLQEVLIANHVIPGQLVYTGSPQTNYTSATGQTITVGTGGLADGSGSVVYYKGELVADIVRGDIITQNGVVHLINEVLPNTNGQLPNLRRKRAGRVLNSRLFGRRGARLVRDD